MGYLSKPKPVSIYATLIHVYPLSFRRYYATTMVQTFDDMLSSEDSWAGQAHIWLRTLADLPVNAVKEHIKDEGGFFMNRDLKRLIAVSLVAVVIVGAGAYWFGTLRARQTIAVQRVGVAQIADAMQQDDFYSSYGDSALLFSGAVASSKQGMNATLVTFSTGRPYSVTCQFPVNLTVKTGQVVSIAAPAGSAERQPKGVLLHDCVQS
jgi:hypothetical protein